MTKRIEFAKLFEKLTGNAPFPWQQALYKRFMAGNMPDRCDIPTGLGKTNVIAVWLAAWLHEAPAVPRRLVYVVNRRTVVDQTTNEVKNLRDNLKTIPGLDEQQRDLGISTLRGQYADNREWSANPALPAVICGTVDMIGSRLLFSGYRCGWKSKPLHAGFLGQDSLLVHDEAHLEPAFQRLADAIKKEQQTSERVGELPWPKMQVMQLTATVRDGDSQGTGETLELSDEDLRNSFVNKRIHATKTLHLVATEDEKKLADELSALAHDKFGASGKNVLIYARKVEDVEKIATALRKHKPKPPVATLTGTMRGWERDELVRSNEVFARFLPQSEEARPTSSEAGTAYLVCTSAGEVGVNISADHLVSDLSTYESMAQRFGRVNRFGDETDTEIHVLYPSDLEASDALNDLDKRRKLTLKLLRNLKGDACPAALNDLDSAEKVAAFSPEPTYVDTSDILFDAWAMTSIRDKMPGRPPVEPYLHGISEWEPPRTQVAWREEVEILDGDLFERYPPEVALDRYPLKPHELLEDRSDRVFKHLVKLAERTPDAHAWLVDQQGHVQPMSLEELANKKRKERIEHQLVLLSPQAGGLDEGHLSSKASFNSKLAYDVADRWGEELTNDKKAEPTHRRVRVWGDDPTKTRGMRCVLTIDTRSTVEEESNSDEDDADDKDIWSWYVRPQDSDDDQSKKAKQAVELHVHVQDVVRELELILNGLPLSKELVQAIILGAQLHDLGKQRELFQRILGNFEAGILLAKSGGRRTAREVNRHYRHEFGSLLDLANGLPNATDEAKERLAEFQNLSDEMQDVVLHLIAVHHGRGRPHFSREESFDPEYGTAEAMQVAAEVPRRYARLQRRYGHWGLAYLESLLRAADWAASAEPSEFVKRVEMTA